MIAIKNSSKCATENRSRVMSSESGAALATAILMLALLSAIAMTVLAVVQTETRIAASDLKRTQAFYAASAGIEKMTSDFSQLFSQTSKPTTAQLNSIATSQPDGLDDEGYTLSQTLVQDATTLAAMRTTQGIVAPKYPSVLMPTDSPFAGLNASVNPFTLTTVARAIDGTEVGLTRQMNNYMIPIFQFGVFSDNDLEFWPEPPMTFNGRVHSNGNIYFGGDCTFLAKVTTANEAVRDKLRNNARNDALVGGASATGGFTSNPRWKLTPAGATISLTQGSVNDGPNLTPQPRADGRGIFDGSPVGFNPSPNGTNNANWSTYSVNPFGGLLLTKSTGVKALKLPLQLSQINKQPMELIKRTMPDDASPGLDALSESRYQTKARIRILIDDEGAGNGTSNEAGIGNDPATGLQKGVALSEFNPVPLDGGRALRPVNDNGTYGSTVDWFQGDPARAKIAETVRGVRNDYASLIAAATASTAGGGRATLANYTANGSNVLIPKSPNGAVIPPGAGIKGRILIEIIPPLAADGTQPAPIDVTTTILSMGMTVGEPNAIVMLQRPEWANFMQGSRDRKGTNMYLTYFLHNGITTDAVVATRRALADGEVSLSVPFNAAGFISTATDNNLDDDPHPTTPFNPTAATMARDDKPFTITVGAAGAPVGSVVVPVGPLTQAIPSGTVLDFGGGKTARLSANALAGAVTLTVSPLTTALVSGNFAHSGLNRIVPINVYNVREGRMDEALTSTNAYQRGITSVIDINMRNLARWVDGVYDTTLFTGIATASSPKSSNIEGSDGYTVYISDRRGDRVKGERNTAGSTIQTTNGMVDNEDIYNYTAATPVLEPGEDVIDDGYDVAASANKRGSLQLDKCELPSPAAITATVAARPTGAAGVPQTRFDMASHVSRWNPVLDTALSCAANQYWFRRGVRVFNGDNLQISGGAGKLSQNKGLTIATENMMYIWGNFNTTGINVAPSPAGVSSLNESTSASRYNGNQVPASLVADAVFPISKTWYDALPAMYPEGWTARVADAGNASDTSTIAVTLETAVRAGVISGSTQSAMVGTAEPTGADYLDWLNGGVHNFPRFLEVWSVPSAREERWNYVGSFIILFNSTQAVAPWSVGGAVVYYPPIRNWAFDITFTDPNRLPPGTPQFQHIEPTGFRQIL